MMTPEEVSTLLMQIAAIDNRSIAPDTADAWELMLAPYVTLKDATQAYIEFYADPKWADNPRRPWIMPADINRRVSRMLDKRRASDEDIYQAMKDRTDGLTTFAEWEAKQQVKQLTAGGMSLEQAVQQAITAAERKQVEAPQPKPKPEKKPTWHFIGHRQAKAGDMNIQDVIGGAA